MRPFPECRRVQGHFGGCCGNCKWPDHAARCRFPTVIDLDSDGGDDPPDDEEEDKKPDVRRAIEWTGVTADHPIVIE